MFLQAEFDRHVYDALKAGIEGPACTIVRRAAPLGNHDLEGANVGLYFSILFGFEAWRQLRFEYLPVSKGSGINHVFSSLPMSPAKGCDGVRSKMHEAEGHITEACSVTNGSAFDEVKNVISMKTIFQELHLHV